MSEGNRELAQVEAPHPTGILERFDLADDGKIIAALSKRVTQGFTYKVNGKYGLSSAGTLWAAREFAKQGEVYRVIGDPKIALCPLDPECVNVWVTVQRFFVNPATGQEIALDSTFGHKRMSRKTKRYKDENSEEFEMVEDPEFTTKAITKAERNGKLKLMPKDAVTNLVAKAVGQPAPAQNAAAKGTAKPAGAAAPAAGPAKPSTSTPATSGGASTATPSTSTPATAGGDPAKQEESKKAASASAQPAATAQPAAAAPAQTTAPAEPAGKPKMTKEVMVQKLDAVSKMVFGTQDGVVARQKLAAITGKPSPADLTDEEIKKVGNAINAVAKKTATIEGNDIIKTADKSVLWKGPAVAEAPAAPAGDPPPEEEMF